jgi:hypothetical protein
MALVESSAFLKRTGKAKPTSTDVVDGACAAVFTSSAVGDGGMDAQASVGIAAIGRAIVLVVAVRGTSRRVEGLRVGESVNAVPRGTCAAAF